MLPSSALYTADPLPFNGEGKIVNSKDKSIVKRASLFDRNLSFFQVFVWYSQLSKDIHVSRL